MVVLQRIAIGGALERFYCAAAQHHSVLAHVVDREVQGKAVVPNHSGTWLPPEPARELVLLHMLKQKVE